MIPHKFWIYLGGLFVLLGVMAGIYGTGYSHSKGKVTAKYETILKEQAIEHKQALSLMVKQNTTVQNDLIDKQEELRKANEQEKKDIKGIIDRSDNSCLHDSIPNALLKRLRS